MKRLTWICLALGLVGCNKEPAASSPVPQRSSVRAAATRAARTASTSAVPKGSTRANPTVKKTTHAEAPVPYDKEDPVPLRPRFSPALQKEVDAYLAEPPIRITAAELVKAYKEEAKADDRFKERKVWVTGYVLRVGRGTLGEPYVELEPGKTESGEVRCFFEKGWALSVAELKEGQEVTIEGRVSAKTGSAVRLDLCRLRTPAEVQSITTAVREVSGNKE